MTSEEQAREFKNLIDEESLHIFTSNIGVQIIDIESKRR